MEGEARREPQRNKTVVKFRGGLAAPTLFQLRSIQNNLNNLDSRMVRADTAFKDGTLGRCGRIARPRDTWTRGESGHYTDGHCAQGRRKCTGRTSGTDGSAGRHGRTLRTDATAGGLTEPRANGTGGRHGRALRTDATGGRLTEPSVKATCLVSPRPLRKDKRQGCTARADTSVDGRSSGHSDQDRRKSYKSFKNV